MNEKILFFSYQLVNPVISELFEAKAKCFEGFGENYQVFRGLSAKFDTMESNYLNTLHPGLDENPDNKKLRDGTLETIMKRARMLKKMTVKSIPKV